MSRASPARVAALRSLIAVEDGAHLEEALADLAPPADPDRSLAWFLAYGVVRRRGHVDAALRPHLRTPLGGLEPAVRACLRVAAFEVLYARTKPHAVVHQAVEVAKAVGARRASGLVNAVARRIQPVEELTAADAADAPSWLVARWTERYGSAAQEWFAQAAEPPPLFAVLRDSAALEGLADVGPEATGIDGVVRLSAAAGRVEHLPGFAEGRWWVQDLASARVADLVQAAPGQRILDACAAPGGKSFRMAAAGAHVFAADRSAARLNLLTASADRLHLDIPTRIHDWTDGPVEGELFDAVLVDAPCTALGTLRRNPEVKWRRQLVDVLAMPEKQSPILANAAGCVSRGGALVYAVCSPEPEEGPQVVDAFVAAHADFTVEETLSTAPPTQGEDGFYAARMRRS